MIYINHEPDYGFIAANENMRNIVFETIKLAVENKNVHHPKLIDSSPIMKDRTLD